MALTKVTGDFIETGSITQGHLHSSHGITTSHITEGDKLFFTNARVDSRVGSLSTSDLSEGTNLYFTNARAISALTAGTNIAIASNGTISSTDTNTTYTVGDGGLTQNNFTNTLKGKLDGIATGATNVTNNNQLTNGAGYITSADGGNATTLDGIDSSQFLRSDGNDTFNGNLTVGSTTRSSNTVVRVLSNDSHNAGFEAYGNSQGTGYLYVGQDASYGGGISYNGDGSPLFAMYESDDKITFFRRDNNTTREVFSYPYNTDTVTFNGAIYATSGNFSGSINAAGGTMTGNLYYTSLLSSVNNSYGFVGNNVYADTINGIGSDPLELNYYGGGSVKIGSGTNGSKALYASALYAAGNAVIHSGNIGSQTVATAGNAGHLDGYDHSQFSSILARYITTAGSNNRIRITAPFNTNTGKMFQVTVDIYNSYTIHSYRVGGYMYSTTNQWYIPTAVYTGNGSPDIYVGRDSSGKAYISIANGNYTGVTVHSFTGGYAAGTADAYNPWTISINAGSENYVGVSVTTTVTSSNVGSYALPISGGTMTGNLTAPRFNVDNGSNYIDTVSNYLSFTSAGNEMTIGGSSTMYINYRAPNGGTPHTWYWKAGSSGSWANQNFGNVAANGTITCTGGITTGVSADIKRTGINNTKYISLSGHLSGYGVNDYPTLKTNFHVLYFDAGGVYTGYITSTGGFTDQSDRSLKENIEDIPDALSKVMNLRGRYFTWINELQGNERQVGFIAQEVEEQLPEVVSVGAGDTKGVAYGKVTALLVNAMKEQQAQIELLKQEVELLKQ